MARYYYNKYNAGSSTTYSNPGSFFHGWNSTSYTDNFDPAYTGYAFNSTQGFYGTGYVAFPHSVGQVAYSGGGSSMLKMTALSYAAPLWTNDFDMIMCTGTVTYSQGSLMQAGIEAEDGVYPANGYYATDGYWYVRQGLVPVKGNPFFFGMNF